MTVSSAPISPHTSPTLFPSSQLLTAALTETSLFLRERRTTRPASPPTPTRRGALRPPHPASQLCSDPFLAVSSVLWDVFFLVSTRHRAGQRGMARGRTTPLAQGGVAAERRTWT